MIGRHKGMDMTELDEGVSVELPPMDSIVCDSIRH